MNTNRQKQSEQTEIRKRNHAAIYDLFQILNKTKGYEVSYNSPANGKMLVSFNGKLYLLELDQLLGGDDMSIDEQLQHFQFLLK